MATKILITGPADPTLVGGQVTHLKNLEKLKEYDTDLKIELFNTAISVGSYCNKIFRVVKFIFSLLNFSLKANRFCVVHINSTMNNYSFLRDSSYAIISIVFRRKIVFQYHGGNPEDISLLKYSFFSKLFSFVAGRCEIILVLTIRQKNSLISRFGIYARVVRNYVELPMSKKDREYCGVIRLLYLGRLNKEKGVFEFIEACRLLKLNGFTFTLTVAGSGPEFENLKEYAINLGMEDRIEFLGEVKGYHKQQVLERAHMMVLPSYSEGLPYGILEGIANGLVIVSTRVGAIPEILDEENEVVFVKLRDPRSLFETIANLISHPEKMALMASCSYEKSKQFSFEKMADLYLKVWSGIKFEKSFATHNNPHDI